MRKQGEVLSRLELAEQVWDINFNSNTNVVEVAVRRLRGKVDDPFDQKLLHGARHGLRAGTAGRLMQPRSGSLRRWLSRWLAMLTFLGLGGVCLAVYYATNLNLQTRQEALLQQKMEVIRHLVDENAATGDSTTLRHKLSDFSMAARIFPWCWRLMAPRRYSARGSPRKRITRTSGASCFPCRRRARRAMPCTPSWCWTSRPTCICAPRWPGP